MSTIVANLRILTSGISDSQTVADLRGDAYGHGSDRVAQVLLAHGVTSFVVSRQSEGRLLAPFLPGATVHVAEAGECDLSEFDTGEADTSEPGTGEAGTGEAGTGEQPAVVLLGPELYGLSPRPATRPAMRLVTEAVSVKRVEADRGVSYGYTYRTRTKTTLVLAGLGYADGLPRVASNRAPVRVGPMTAPVAGRIAMDQFVVDVGDTRVEIGDDVVLFGDADAGEPTILDWSVATGLRPEVITTGLGSRIVRDYGRS